MAKKTYRTPTVRLYDNVNDTPIYVPVSLASRYLSRGYSLKPFSDEEKGLVRPVQQTPAAAQTADVTAPQAPAAPTALQTANASMDATGRQNSKPVSATDAVQVAPTATTQSKSTLPNADKVVQQPKQQAQQQPKQQSKALYPIPEGQPNQYNFLMQMADNNLNAVSKDGFKLPKTRMLKYKGHNTIEPMYDKRGRLLVDDTMTKGWNNFLQKTGQRVEPETLSPSDRAIHEANINDANKRRWAYEDTMAELDARERELNLQLNELRKAYANKKQYEAKYYDHLKRKEKNGTITAQEQKDLYNWIGIKSAPYPLQDKEHDMMQIANRNLEEIRTLKEEVKKHKNDKTALDGLRAGLRGIKDKTNLRTWSFGLVDFNEQVNLSAISKKLDRNQKLTEPEQLALDAYFLKNDTDNAYRNQLSGWYKAGEVTSESLPFMLEMLANPASGIGKSVAKSAAKKYLMHQAKKKLSKEAVENMTEKQLMRAITQEMGKKAAKRSALKAAVPTRVVGDAAGSAIMAGTTGQAGVMADALRRNTFEGEDMLTAYTKAFTSRAIENHSEMLGNYFGPLLKPITRPLGRAAGAATKWADKWAAKGATKVGANSMYQGTKRFLTELPRKELVKNFNNLLKKSNYNGTFGEYAEEVLGNMENALLVGDMNFSTDENGVFNKELNIETFAGVAFTSGLLGTAQLGLGLGETALGPKWTNYQNRRALRRAEHGLEQLYGEQGANSIVQEFNMGDEKGRTSRIAKRLSEAARRGPEYYYALLDYLKFYEKAKGGELGNVKRSMEQSQQENVRDEAFDNGTIAETPEDRKSVVDTYNQALDEVRNTFDSNTFNMELIEQSPLQALDEIGENLSEEQRDVLDAYAQAQAQYDGMVVRMSDDVEVAAQDAREEAHDMAFGENGVASDFVRQATVGGRPVIIYSQSDSYAMVRDMNTGRMMAVNPDEIDEDSVFDVPMEDFAEAYSNAARTVTQERMNNELTPETATEEELAEEEQAEEELEEEQTEAMQMPPITSGMKVTTQIGDEVKEGTILSYDEENGNIILDFPEGQTALPMDKFNESLLQAYDAEGNLVYDRQTETDKEATEGPKLLTEMEELKPGSVLTIGKDMKAEVVVLYISQRTGEVVINAKLRGAKTDKIINLLIPDSLLLNWDGETVFIQEHENFETWSLFNTVEEAVQNTDDLFNAEVPASSFTRANINDLHDQYFPEETDNQEKPAAETEASEPTEAEPQEESTEAEPTEENTEAPEPPAPALGQKITLNIDGNTIDAEVTNPHTEDGNVLLMRTDGTGAFQLTPTEFSNQAQQITDHYGKIIFDRNAKAEKPTEEPQTEEPKNEDPQPTANDQQTESELPKPETEWKEILDKTNGDAKMAEDVVRSMIEDKKKELKSEERKKGKKTTSIDEKVAAAQEKKAKLDAIKSEIAHWEEVLKARATYEQKLKQQDQERLKAEAEAQRAEKERSRQTVDGVPEWEDDTAVDARNRGFRRTNGHKIERPGKVFGVAGKRVEVKFTDKVKQKGKAFVLEASQLQPSHYGGQQNPYHFLPEAQPKDRSGVVSVMTYQQMASQIKPEEITSNVTAYTGAPNVNERGEVIQGNNRSAALIHMWENHPEVAQRYKQYLIDHAKEFGLNAEGIAAMERPILVNMLDVNDEQAITLGQYDVKDTESGGVERIKAKNVAGKMGADMSRFASILLSSSDEDTSISVLINANAIPALKWLQQKGYISATQYSSAFDANGNVTAEAENDLKAILSEQIFHDAPEQIETAFNNLPAKAQRAILAVMHRDMASPFSEQMIKDVQASIMAFNELMQEGAFADAKKFSEARSATDLWKGQYRMDFFTSESYLPENKYSNFALHLAAMYKTETQKLIQNTFNEMFDLIQGTKERDLFNSDTFDGTPKTLREAIKQVLNIDYNGRNGSNVLGKSDEAGQQGGRGGNQPSKPRGRTKSTTEQAQPQGRTKQNGIKPQPETMEPTESERTEAPAKESAPKSEKKTPKKTEGKADEAAPLTEDEFEEALNTDDIDKVTDALKLTRNAIELNSIDDIQEGDIVLITHMNAELLKKGETGTYVYKARKKLSRSYDLESVLADGSISITNEDIESIKRTPGGSLTIYRVKPELADRLKRGEEEKQRKLREENLKFEEEMRKKAEASAKRREKARAQEKANEERAERIFDMAQEAENVEDFFKMASEIYQITKTEAILRGIFNLLKNHTINSSREVGHYLAPYSEFLTPNEEQEAKRSEDSPTSRKHKAEAEAQTATTEDTAMRDALADIMQQSGLEVFVDEKAQQVLDEVNERARLSAKQKRALETASIPQKEEYQQTVVSSADGAKILKNLDKLAEEYENSSYTKEKTFLGALAKALGASTKGSSSQYATFETINGQIVTIRLANHNASSKRMDDAGRDDAISIVVSPKPNEGVTNDGDAHIVEFYYNSIKLRKAKGHPLAEIVRSIKQALYSGEYKDTTGLAEIQEVNTTFEKLREHRVFHGSGAEFDAFDHSHMGEGEGAQAYGWGTYVTEVEGIGRMYAESYKAGMFKSGFGDSFLEELKEAAKEGKFDEVKQQLLGHYRYLYDSEKAKGVKKDDAFISDYEMLERIKEEDIPSKFLYTVEIPEDNGENYLSWYEPLTSKDIKRIGKLLDSKKMKFDGIKASTYLKKREGEIKGFTAYLLLGDAFGYGQKPASEALMQAGYTGISYPAEARSGGRKDGARNFVIFNEKDAQITDHIRFFRTPGGEAYGFTVNGKIYLDPRIATAETAIHEYAHLWADMLRQMNPEAWNDIVQLMKGTSVWDEVKSLYPELKTDDEIADEVLAHYSGRQGAAKLREEQQRIAHDQNMDLRSKATAIAALQRVKQALTKFWKGVADLLHIRFTTAEEVADRVLADLLHGVNPNKYIKRKGKGVQKLHLNDKTLAGIHNITEEKLRKALNLGGLANPSLAIIDTAQNKHEGFGEISLIAPSELVDKETGHTAGTWTTDAYTQRYPYVERVMSESGYKKFDKWVESLDLTDSEKAEVRRQAKDSLENNSTPAWEMMYLREKGIDIKAYTSEVTYRWHQLFDTYDSVDELLEGMKQDEELQKKVINYVKAELSEPIRKKIRAQFREQIKEETGEDPVILPPRYMRKVTEIFNRDYAKDLFGEDLMPGEEDVKKVMQQLFDLHNRTKQVDFSLSKSKASTYVHSHDLYSDYLRWQNKKLKEFGVKGRLFRGYSADGSRKYIPETLKNVSKAMVADAKGQTNGGEMVSLGSFVAKFADRVDSTDEMRANKKRLANNESKQGFYSEWMPTYNELAHELSDDIFAGEQRLHDIAVQDNPVKYAKKEYGITLSKSFMNKLNAFKKAIREDMTSAYFETKFERPVYLNEFAAAVIPSDLSEDVKGGLEKSGIAIYEYDPKIEGDRDRATNAAFEADNRIRFQLIGEKGAANMDKAEAANRTAQSLHLDNVTILSEEDLASLTPKQQRAKGWFDPKTGRIYINASNHANEADVVQTVLHEAVAHYGLRALFGKDFDTALDKIYRAAGSSIRQEIQRMMQEKGLSKRAATEEYLAGLAETTNFDSLPSRVWNAIKHIIREMLGKLGIKSEITDDELRYQLWRSYDLLRGDRDTLKGKVRDAAMQYELGVGNYGDMYRETRDMHSNLNLPDARSRYDYAVRRGDHWYNNFGYKFYEGHVDAMAPARALVDAIQAVSGNRPIQTYENFLAEENRLSSKNMAEQKRFRRRFIEPMRKAVSDFCLDAGLDYEDIKKYVILKHGLERNEAFAKRDAEAKYRLKYETADKQLADGKIDKARHAQMVADIAQRQLDYYTKLRETKDYSGITTLMAIDNLPDAEAAAADLIAKIEDGNETKRDEMWRKINDLTSATLQKRLDTGLISQRQYDELSKMFDYYVPLQGWDKKTAEEMYDYTKEYMTMPGTVRIHHANGRRSVAGDPLSQLEYTADHVITSGNRNVMKQTFANFVGARPSNLATVSRAWYTLDPATGEWVATWPDIDHNLSGQQQQAQLAQFEADMEAKEANGEAKRMTSDLRTAYPMANAREHKREHTVNVYIGGQEYRVYIHGNPAAAQAINGVRPQMGAVARALHRFKNLQSRLLTSLNIEFTLPNLVRDSIWTLTMMLVNERPAYLKDALKYGSKLIYSGNPIKPHHYWTDRLIYRYEHNQLDDNDEIDRMFGEFMSGGGETGFAALRDIDDYRTDLRKYLENEANKEKINAKRVAQLGTKTAQLIGAGLERINRDAELTNRFITYMASRKSGRSVQQSVIDAKNITINFNRHGSGNYLGAYCQGAYYFYNAAVQALYTTQQSAKHNPVKALVGIGITPMMVGALVAMACAYGSGDDGGYYDIPDWERKANVCITIGGGKYIKIPLPPELRVFYAIGEGMAAMAAGKQSETEAMTSAITELAGLLPLDMTGHGGNPLANLAPSVVQPITDTFVFNRNFFGLPIYNDSDYGRWDPEYTKAYRNTPQAYIELSRVINNLTGGSDIRKSKYDTILTNPSVIQHIFEGYTGNMVSIANKTAKTLENIKNGEVEIGRIPISRRFFSDIDERAQGRNANNEYRELHDIYEQVQHDVSKLRRQYEDARAAGDEQAMDDAVNKMQTLRQSDDFATYAYFKLTKADKYIRQLRKTANNPYLDRDQTRQAEQEITTVKRNIIDHHQQFVDDLQKNN